MKAIVVTDDAGANGRDDAGGAARAGITTLDDAVAAFNRPERASGQTIICVHP